MTPIEKILQEKGPLMSSDVARILETVENIPYNTATKRISRSRNILRIKGFFQSNQSLCFLTEHEDDEVFSVLKQKLFEHGKKYWYCLNAIRLHGGSINRKYLECYTNYPILPLKGHIPFNQVMQTFVSEGILVYSDDMYHLNPKYAKERKSRQIMSTIDEVNLTLLSNFNSLTKNIGLISYNTGEMFGEYGKFRWAFKGVSNITGLVVNDKAGFLLADIIIGVPVYKNDIAFFIEKVKHVQSFKKASKLIPFLIVDDLDKDALIELKRHGIVVGLTGELFGSKYATSLRELLRILNNVGASMKESPDKYLELIKQLRKYNEGLLNNIRGTFFEFLVGHIHSIQSCSSVTIGKEITDDKGNRHEMDIISTYGDKIIMAECKAEKSQIDKEYIDKWLTKKLPAYKAWFSKQETWNQKQLEFEFWSINGFTDDALERLDGFISTTRKYKLKYFYSNQIRDVAITLKNKNLKEAIDDYFLKTTV